MEIRIGREPVLQTMKMQAGEAAGMPVQVERADLPGTLWMTVVVSVVLPSRSALPGWSWAEAVAPARLTTMMEYSAVAPAVVVLLWSVPAR